MATIWRGGCIIRARFLNRIREAYDENPALPSLLVAPYFAQRGRGRSGQLAPGGRRRGAGRACRRRRSPPRWPTTTACAGDRLPAALIQGLRDNFGAHTYRRTDNDGTFHTLWAGDGSEMLATRRLKGD